MMFSAITADRMTEIRPPDDGLLDRRDDPNDLWLGERWNGIRASAEIHRWLYRLAAVALWHFLVAFARTGDPR